jgi:hypothetical protein
LVTTPREALVALVAEAGVLVVLGGWLVADRCGAAGGARTAQ